MLTREEQITVLEKQFNYIVQQMADAQRSAQQEHFDHYMSNASASGTALNSIIEALTYLRCVIPNPGGRVDPITPRQRRLDMRP